MFKSLCVFPSVSCFVFKGSINVSCECHPFPPAGPGPVHRNNITSLSPCHTHFLHVTLDQSEARDPDLDQSEARMTQIEDTWILEAM